MVKSGIVQGPFGLLGGPHSLWNHVNNTWLTLVKQHLLNTHSFVLVKQCLCVWFNLISKEISSLE